MVVSVRKNNDIRFYVILLIIQIILSIIYAVYIIIDERKKWQKKESFLNIHFIMKWIIFYTLIWLKK